MRNRADAALLSSKMVMLRRLFCWHVPCIRVSVGFTGVDLLRVYLLVSPRVIRVVHKGMHLRVFHEVCCSTEVLLYSINTVRCSLVLR
jgi:hypothetical protein